MSIIWTKWPPVTVLVFLSILLWPMRCMACRCYDIDLDEAIRRSKAVFRGRVVALGTGLGTYIHEETRRKRTHEYVRAHMEILASYRGSAQGIVTIATGVSDGDCGFPFEPNGEYLVFAREATGVHSGSDFYTDICTGSRPVEYAEADLIYFGDPQLPARRRRQVESALVVTAVILLVAAGYWYALRRPRPPA